MSIPDQDYFDKGTDAIDEEEVKRALNYRQKLLLKMRKSEKLSAFLDEFEVLFSLISDYVKGNYKEIPYRSIAAIAFTLLYVVNVLDFLPDFIPGLGLLDDVTVIGMCLKMVGKDLANYKSWSEKK